MVIPVIRGGNSRIGLNRRNKGDEERAGSEIGATKGPPVSQREGAIQDSVVNFLEKEYFNHPRKISIVLFSPRKITFRLSTQGWAPDRLLQ